jgi:hypothetical protein
MAWLISQAMMNRYSNSHCSPVQVAESSAENCLGGEQSVQSKSMPMPQAFLLHGKTTAAWNRFPSGMTSEHLTEQAGEDVLMSYLADFHVNRTALQVQGEAETTTATFGTTWRELLQKYDLAPSFLKMFQESSQASPACAYAAGLIDGEGAIGLNQSTYKNRRSYNPEIRISLAIKGNPALGLMQRAFGGIMKKAKKATSKWSATTMWRIGGREAGAFLIAIGPYLQIKAEQAAICLAVLKIRMTATNVHINGNAVWTDDMTKQCAVLKSRLNELNQRGVATFSKNAIAKYVDGEWVTRQKDLLSDSLIPFSGTWPKWGSMRNGELFRLPMSEAIAKERESGLLPRPQSSDGPNWYAVTQQSTRRRVKDGRQMMLIHAVGLTAYTHWNRWLANPPFWEAMMGWPIGWTDLQPLGTDKIAEWQQQHGGFCQDSN